jgi:hypothetical protein
MTGAQSNEHESSLLPLLYNSSSNGAMLLNMLPNIKPKELHLNSSVDDLLKKFASESKYFSLDILILIFLIKDKFIYEKRRCAE